MYYNLFMSYFDHFVVIFIIIGSIIYFLFVNDKLIELIFHIKLFLDI